MIRVSSPLTVSPADLESLNILTSFSFLFYFLHYYSYIDILTPNINVLIILTPLFDHFVILLLLVLLLLYIYIYI